MNNSGGGARLALYRKYRPTSLAQVIGQPQVTEILQTSLDRGAFAHAYLFTGQRGTGKTTVARILAHLVNGLDYSDNLNNDSIDIIEIDAASNNGVDDVRQIRDSVQLAPMNCRYKIYIIDEFHMLSKPAFNALLKTIEEPPEYVIFVLATTELQKVPATILSRVQRFHFKPVPVDLLTKHLRMIAESEQINVDDDALRLIAEHGGGSVRDAITLLDQLAGNQSITVETVNDVLGLISQAEMSQLATNITKGKPQSVISQVNQLISNGVGATALAKQLIDHLTKLAPDRPELYRLIERLLEVGRAGLPEVKLMAILVDASLPRVSTSPSAAPKATKAAQSTVAQATAKSTPVSKPATKANSTGDSRSETTSTKKAASTAAPVPAEPTEATESIKELVWEDVINQLAKQNRPSAKSLLEQADYRYSASTNTLTLFFGKTFHRKQAKTGRFQDSLLTTLDELYQVKPMIVISEEPAPLDSDVAAVLSVVGGEVTTISDGTI